jgi:hypothetical protein
MKVKIGDLTPNPFRNIAHYPIDKVKVEALAASIGQTGFWDNILARKVNGKVQIAYGHHRLAALRKVKGTDDVIDIPVKDLDDATMLKIMANENMDEWRMRPGVINETVAATKKFLEEHPEEVRKLLPVSVKDTALVIAKFLNWPRHRVTDALASISDHKKGAIAIEASHTLTSQQSERRFASAVKSLSKSTPVSPEVQVRAAKRIVEGGDMSEAGIRAAVVDEVYPTPAKKKESGLPIMELRDEIKKAKMAFDALREQLVGLMSWKDQIRDCDYQKEILALSISANAFLQIYKSFIGGNNEKQVQG